MIQKKHLVLLSIGAIQILLSSLFYLTQAQKGREPAFVDVVNLPLDEQGNLKIATQPRSTVVTATENQAINLTVGDDHKLLCEANVEGWKKAVAYVHWSSEPSTQV